MSTLVDSPGYPAARPAYVGRKAAAGLLLVSAATLACTAPEPDPAAVRLAALTAAAAADSIDDLRAVDDPDAAGVRDAFRNATREALAAARQARDTAPAATATAFAESLKAAETAEHLGDALALALEARGDYAAARDHLAEVAATMTRAHVDAEAGRDLRALEGARAVADQARSKYEEAWASERQALRVWMDANRNASFRITKRSPSEWTAEERQAVATLDRARADLNRAEADRSRATDASSRASSAVGRLVRRLRAAGRLDEQAPTPQEIERLEAEAASLAAPALEAATAEAEAADRAEKTMRAAEARADEALIAYRAAVDAWRALLEDTY